MFDQRLASIAEAHQVGEQRIEIEGRTLAQLDRFDAGGTRAKPLQQGAHAGHDHRRAAVG